MTRFRDILQNTTDNNDPPRPFRPAKPPVPPGQRHHVTTLHPPHFQTNTHSEDARPLTPTRQKKKSQLFISTSPETPGKARQRRMSVPEDFAGWTASRGVVLSGVAPRRIPGRGIGLVTTRPVQVSFPHSPLFFPSFPVFGTSFRGIYEAWTLTWTCGTRPARSSSKRPSPPSGRDRPRPRTSRAARREPRSTGSWH